VQDTAGGHDLSKEGAGQLIFSRVGGNTYRGQTIINNGTLGGVFEARGAGLTVPVIETIGGTKGIRFDGNDFMQLASALGGALTPPPAGLVGLDPTRTYTVWLSVQVTVPPPPRSSAGNPSRPSGN
jgi:autotransporter-associated beta strand protein